MPRTLPWLAGKTKREVDSPGPTTKTTSTPRVKDESGTGTPKGKEIKKEKDTPVSKRDILRSSPSPPSSPIHRCPSEEFLHEGLENDDIYMMVEDEFYSIAQTFTRHLHYAEYVRRKREAKDRNADAIRDIARPTDGWTPVSAEMKKREKARELERVQEGGLDSVLGKSERRDDGDGGEEEEELEESSWAGTHLQELILSPRRARSLVGLKEMRSSTRAAAGFAQAETSRSGGGSGSGRRFDDDDAGCVNEGKTDPAILDETTDDDGDLDAGVRSSSPTTPRASNVPSRSALRHSESVRPAQEEFLDTMVRQGTTTKGNSASSRSRPLHDLSSLKRPAAETRRPRDLKKGLSTESRSASSDTMQAKRKLVFDDFDELPELPKPNIQSEKLRSLYTHNKQKKIQGKEMGSKKTRLNDVPMFLI
ncbi:hypothetical protein BDV06DRAFT_136592 [Aspergillus oleicola]